MTNSNHPRSNDERFEAGKFENNSNYSADHGGVAELDQPKRSGLGRLDSGDSGRATSAAFRMFPSCYKQGFTKLALAAVCGGLGAFLFSEVPHTPGLTLNLAIIGGIGIAAAAVLAALAYRDLTGRLIVNEQGISLDPRWAGFHLSWKQVSSWQVTDEIELPPQMQQLKLWRKGDAVPVVVDTSWLTAESRGTLRKVLRQVAGEDRLG